MAERRLAPALLLALAAAGCGKAEHSKAVDPAVPIENRAEAKLEETQGPVSSVSGCAAKLAPELDRESILRALGKDAPPAAALDAFTARAGAAFKQAAANLCSKGSVAPGLLKGFTTIIIQNGAGATETAVYEDPHAFRSEDLIFQWTFAEAGLKLPEIADIEMGISCWNDPDQPVCADRTP
jgi:hypothetical protein